ncbi:VOC family protein [Anatilimnocola floriformis]|uniref:VOC family protein n=1 Tax=Anatilimnocola floriformis TaxID=2948575 RepID=UPI0020C2574F|nr:VOC family protein [Anatilimnocola floriformis]
MAVMLSLLVLKTRQLERLKDFYENLGIEFVEEKHGDGPLHFAGKLGDAVFEIYPLASGEADATTRLGFVVDDLDDISERLQRLQSVPLKQPKQTEWGRRLVVKDPDGRSVELYQSGE